MATSARILGSGWSNGFWVHASLYRIAEDGKIVFRINLDENSLTGKSARREYTDRQTAEREMRDILYNGKMTTDWEWR